MKLYIEDTHLAMVLNIIKEYDYSFFAFGSRVNGNQKKLSDLDLFYFEDIPSNIILSLEESFEESDLPFKVDLVNFHKCDPDFRNLMLKRYLCIQSSSKLKAMDENNIDPFRSF